MTPALMASLAEALGARTAGAYLGRVCRPDAWSLGFEMPGGTTLGFCWEPRSMAAGLCTWRWPRGSPEEILVRHAQGARVVDVLAVPSEPILRLTLAGSAARALVWEAIGRSANVFLLGDSDAILWSGRLLRGPFRTGRTGDPWTPPPTNPKPAAPSEPVNGVSYLVGDGQECLLAGLLERGRRTALARLDQRVRALERKAAALEGDRREGEEWEGQEPLAQALMASGGLNRRGETECRVLDYTKDPPQEVALALDPAKTVRENAESFFRKVQKGRARRAAIDKFRLAIEEELSILPRQRADLDACADLRLLFPESARAARSQAPQRRRTLPPGVAAVALPKDFVGYAGKNAEGNDAVSFRLGRGGDFWFHAEDYAGCHVVVRCPSKLEDLPFDVEQAAALYAAEHSGAPPGNRVGVVVSRCKFLRRVPGAPGRVMMSTHRRVFVDLPGAR